MTRLYHSLLCAVVSFLLLTSSATAKIIYVSPDGDDLNNGLSWAYAKRTVTAALDVAASRDEIWVRFGVYNERITLKSGVSLYGGFRGTERSLSERPAFPRPSPDVYKTVLDGGGGGSVVTSPATVTRAYRLDGFTVRGGATGMTLEGGAASLLTVANCTISGNGTGVYCNGSSPSFTHCTISGNSAGWGGWWGIL